MRILLLGGSKSGKSMMGQHMARRLSAGAPMYYWATLEPRDGEDRAIVRRHLAERDGWGFETIEQGRQLPQALEWVSPAGTVLFDSITACLACQMFSAPEPDGEASPRTAAMLPGVRPIISFASLPTARTASFLTSTATTDGSRITIPFPLIQTSVFAVPRSIPISLVNMVCSPIQFFYIKTDFSFIDTLTL